MCVCVHNYIQLSAINPLLFFFGCFWQEYEEYLLGEGLITDDMSERIVTSLPKCLSDSTMRSSRESLRSSHDSVRSSQESLLPASSCESLVSQVTPSDTRRLSHWQALKRAVGRFMERGDSTTGVGGCSSSPLAARRDSCNRSAIVFMVFYSQVCPIAQ